MLEVAYVYFCSNLKKISESSKIFCSEELGLELFFNFHYFFMFSHDHLDSILPNLLTFNFPLLGGTGFCGFSNFLLFGSVWISFIFD